MQTEWFLSTPYTILPALQFIKTKPNSSVVSSIFYVLRRPSFCFWGLCTNPNPTAEQLAEIAFCSSLAFGIEPKIAMLSYSERQEKMKWR
jgi:phosphate acetyltransferase